METVRESDESEESGELSMKWRLDYPDAAETGWDGTPGLGLTPERILVESTSGN